MPVSHSLRQNLLKIDLIGTYEPEDIVREFVAAMRDPACPIPVALVLDVTRSESLATRPTPDIRRIAEFLKDYKDRINGRCAVVAESDIHFGLSRLGSAYGEGVGVEAQVFRDLAGALAWLGVDREARRQGGAQGENP